MSELRTMAQDITKNSGDIENYSKEFLELQSQLNQVSREKFNGISLFATSGDASGIKNAGNTSTVGDLGASGAGTTGGTYIDVDGNTVRYNKFSHTLFTSAFWSIGRRQHFAECRKSTVRPVYWEYVRCSFRYTKFQPRRL